MLCKHVLPIIVLLKSRARSFILKSRARAE